MPAATKRPPGRPATPPEVRFWKYVNKTDGCWLWTGAASPQGYGRFWTGERSTGAYRWLYEQAVGRIPEGYQIDHLCRTPRCVRPDHLEAVPPRVNYLRGESPLAHNARKTHCKNGHPFDDENTVHVKRGRECRTCNRAIQSAYELRNPNRKNTRKASDDN